VLKVVGEIEELGGWSPDKVGRGARLGSWL
jgi:hypothetical protein